MRFSVRIKSRGLSLVEMMISLAIIMLISVTVAFLVLASAKANKEGFGFMRTENEVRNSLDLLRRELLVGEFLSVSVSEDGHRVDFTDPWSDSMPYFAYADGELGFYPDTNAEPSRTFNGLSNVQFQLSNNNRILRFEVSAIAMDQHSKKRKVTLTDEILLRNTPDPNDLF